MVDIAQKGRTNRVFLKVLYFFAGEEWEQIRHDSGCLSIACYRMIDHEKIEIVCESGNVGMPKFMQAPLFPFNLYAWMQLLKALRTRDKRRQCPAVIPGDATQK